jgi:Zn-dependent protease with chaperone function
MKRAALALSVAALFCSPSAMAADEYFTLSYEPVALGWSAAEVERAAARQARGLFEQAAREGEPACGELCKRLQTIFERLLPMARAQGPHAARLDWSLTVVRTDAVDALSLPGGKVLVSENFVRFGNFSDDEIAFVIAHEMAHCVLEHERQALSFARMLLPRDVPRTVADIYTEIGHNYALLKAMETVMQQGEYEADELGLLLAAASGYVPTRQMTFIEREAAEAGGRASGVGTHPSAKLRLERLRQRLPLAERLYTLAQSKPG